MKKELKTWLADKDRDYKKGVELFKVLKVDAKKIAFFDVDEPSDMHRNMLAQHLANYDRVYNKVEVKETPGMKVGITASINLKESLSEAKGIEKMVESGKVKIDKNNRINYDDLLDVHKAMYDENGKLYSEIKTLHAKLKAVPEAIEHDDERKTVIEEMLEIQKVIRANWDEIDAAYPANGEQKPKIIPLQPTEPTGAITKVEIEAITDDVIREKSKDMRIEANVAYIRRNSTDAKKAEKVKERIDELVAWGVDYESKIGKN